MSTKVDLMSPEEMADPAISTHRLLGGPRAVLYEGFEPPFYIVSRYRDISEVLMNPETFISGKGQGPNFVPPAGVVSDAPMHTFFRRLVQEDFKPGSIARLRPRAERIAEDLLDTVEKKEVWDLHDDLAFPLPVTMICEIFGVPTDDLWKFKHWSDASVAALSAQDPSAYEEELARMRGYLIDLMHEKHDDLGDDSLLARIARARKEGFGEGWGNGEELSDEEAISLVLQLFVAGNETTTSLITNFMWRMLSIDDLWPRFCAGEFEIDRAINESLRFDPPLLGLFRTTARDVELGGVHIPRDTKVLTHYAAANRDPEMFENPDVFDPDRPIRRVMSFGLGIHFCIGAELAKLEAKTTLTALARRFPDLELVNAGERIGPFLFWGRSKLPVRRKHEPATPGAAL